MITIHQKLMVVSAEAKQVAFITNDLFLLSFDFNSSFGI